MDVSTPRLINRPIDVAAAALSVVMGAFMGVVLLSHIGLFFVPLTPIGLYIGIRVLRATHGTVRGLAWAGIVLNSAIILMFVFAAVRYLMD